MNLRLFLIAALSGALALAGVVEAQPFDGYMTLAGSPSNGGIEIPHDTDLNPTGAFTFEAWVGITNNIAGEDCRTIAGKNYLQAWWVGMCTVGGKRTLRSYLKGGSSARNGGEIPANQLTHVAVVFDGAQRRHYINGQLAATFAEAGPLTTSTNPMRIGSDVSWNFTPDGIIDEVRLWNVARTLSQLRETINVRVTSAQPGLIGVWALDGNGDDHIGGHDGSAVGAGVAFLSSPVAFNCFDSATTLCIQDEHFAASVEWTAGGGTGTGNVVTSAADSGLFWFFDPNNWELMVKVLDGCGLNNRYWMFSAATTNVAYRLTVTDVRAGETKIYFNYPGPPAPAITDTNAFATCP
jgi:hypothetical protein